MNVAIRRWNSAPLDPSPPPFLRSEAELLDAARTPETIPEGATEAASNVEEDTSRHEKPRNDSNGTDPSTAEENEEMEDDIKRGRGWGRGIVRDFRSTVGVSSWC